MERTSRRAFIRKTASAAAAAALVGEAPGKLPGNAPRPEARFKLGLASYTFREFGLGAVQDAAVRLGLERVCLKDVHLPLGSPEASLKETAQKLRSAGLVLYGCGVVYMTSAAEVDRAFAYAEAAGMGTIVGVPDHALLDRVERRVRETGIRAALHNHGPGDRLYPTPGTILEKVAGRDPRMGVCLDIGHCQRSGIDPSEAARACGPRLLDVHLKDVTAATAEGGPIEVGRGAIDIPRFLRTLCEIGFEDTASFEFEKDGRDPLPGLAESVGFVRGVLRALQSAL